MLHPKHTRKRSRIGKSDYKNPYSEANMQQKGINSIAHEHLRNVSGDIIIDEMRTTLGSKQNCPYSLTPFVRNGFNSKRL